MSEKAPLKVYGLTEEHKDFLYSYAEKKLGSRSRTKAILHLINEKMAGEKTQLPATKVFNSSTLNPIKEGKEGKTRIQFSLRNSDYKSLVEVCESTDTSIYHYIIRLILSDIHLENNMLLGNQIEQLRKSNYELHKIGVNINQIAKSLNSGEDIKIELSLFSYCI